MFLSHHPFNLELFDSFLRELLRINLKRSIEEKNFSEKMVDM